MKDAKILTRALPLALVFAVLAACDGGGKVGELNDSSRLQLVQVDLGRLVDIYAYQREDVAIGDRRNRANRRIELVAKNVVINPNIESQSLFSPSGEVVPTADYEFMPFDKTVGHEELLILWDNRPTWTSGSGGTTPSSEVASFDSALQRCKLGLMPLAPSYRGQNTHTRPIPIVPRNAAIRMRFSAKIPVDATFFEVNPSAIQLLEFKGDPAIVQPVDAFRILPYRVVTQDNDVILDTTILGGEGAAGSSTRGLPASADNVTANIRIAIPVRGAVAPTFYVKEDAIPELNSVDSAARNSVIRDFRSGNLADGVSGRLTEPEGPMIVAPLAMGITEIDTANSIVTLDKRQQFVPIRARYPFVDGPLDGTSGLPLGPLAAPIFPTLPAGDILVQVIQVLMPNGTFEAVKLRAEILQNMAVGTVVGDPLLPRLGLAEGQPGAEQGQLISPVRVRLATLLAGKDSLGREHSFQASTLIGGQDCTVRARYYEDIPFSAGSFAVTDRAWRSLFTRIDPQPPASAAPGTQVQPNASVAIEFTKPMDLDQVDNTSNLLITNTHVAAESFEQQMGDPKRATTRIVATRVSDLTGDGTVLRLQPQMGFFHRTGQIEPYCVHVRLGSAGVTDLAGNPLAIFDRPSNPQVSWSVDFTLASAAANNFVAWHTWRFENQDEDGTPAGSADFFGQFRLENGRLIGASGQRFSRSADNQNLVSISRINRGECWDPDGDIQIFPVPPPPGAPGVVPTAPPGQIHPGLLYWQPRMSDSIGPQPPAPQVYPYWSQGAVVPVGRVVEPHKAQGSRMQMRYIEDDFSLSYRQPSDMAIDVEQLYWSPFEDETVLYDVFDRYTMSLAHGPRRCDERWELALAGMPPALFCLMDCASTNSGLSETFSENVLPGTTLTPVFEDKVYRINPNEAFRAPESNVKYVPFPRFDRSYTWRDSRLVTVDAAGQVIGLGGAEEPNSPTPADDTTANIDSPWITDVRDAEFPGAQWVMDDADFHGDFKHDHDPIALPLVVDFKVFPDGAANGVVAGNNGFQVAMLGAPSAGFPGLPNGYYDRVGSGCGALYPAWPHLRVHASGGEDLVSHLLIYVDPANVLTAAASSVKDAGLGNASHALFIAPPGDGMLNWARADFVRKVSTITFGFFDTLQPQRSLLLNTSGTPVPDAGIPNLDGISGLANPRISDLVVQLDPPLARQPAGTSVVVEIRGAETFANSDTLYNPGAPNGDLFDTRGNLLNANYACEAYRYSQANTLTASPRITATGLTRYVTEDELNLIRTPGNNLLPRFLNLRLVMTNNVDVTPALSPTLRSMSVVYRVLPNGQ